MALAAVCSQQLDGLAGVKSVAAGHTVAFARQASVANGDTAGSPLVPSAF
ncbi:hypothetical protein QFZ23_003783 [Arthrobacter globiformis]|nr:hypothetical protein [Arthrobacter globiformis]